MSFTSPSKRSVFIIVCLVSWVVIPIAEAFSIIIYLVLPHNPISDSPGMAYVYWLGFFKVWVLFSPFWLTYFLIAYADYKGAQKIFSFKRNKLFISILCWSFNSVITLECMFATVTLLTFWMSDAYWSTYFVMSVPVFLSTIFFGYAFLSASSEWIGDSKT